jgi:predicted ATP-grasp superfamily ATP-dependent carboligase
VLVLDGETRAALAATRSLARAGEDVSVASATGSSVAGASRFAHRDISLGDASRDPASWAAKLQLVLRGGGFDSVIPVAEASLGNVYRFEIDVDPRVISPPRASYERAVDKLTLLRTAEGLGIPIPRTTLVRPDAACSPPDPGLRFPLVLKPRRSRFWRDGAWRSGTATIVRDLASWRAALARADFSGGALQQDYIPGHGEAIFVLARAGEVLVEFAHRRLREHPPTGGQSVLRESVAPDPLLAEMSRRLIGSLAWTGVAMVEFRRAVDGTPYLMEVNPRLWGSVQLAIEAGVDFPRLLLALHRGETIPRVKPRIGVRSRWLLGDVDHLLVSLRSARVRQQTGASVASLISDFVRSFVDDSREEVLKRDDWRPFLRELALWLRALLPQRFAARGV